MRAHAALRPVRVRQAVQQNAVIVEHLRGVSAAAAERLPHELQQLRVRHDLGDRAIELRTQRARPDEAAVRAALVEEALERLLISTRVF